MVIQEKILYTTILVLLFCLIVLSMMVGSVSLSVPEIWRALIHPDVSASTIIIHEIRVPRTILAILVGGTLGLSGAALQGLLRNPLAEPGLIGASSAAAFGAAAVFYFGLAAHSVFILPLAGMSGALIAVGILYLLGGRNASALGLILSGVAISAFASALTALAINFASSYYAALEITFWLLGSLADRSIDHVYISLPGIAIGCFLILTCRRSLTVLSLGEDTAQTLGVNLVKLKALLIVGIALSVGAAVSVSGAIGFVGLVVPHLLRPYVGYEPGRLLIISAIGGAALLLAADITVRFLSTGIEIKLGVLTALIGGPFFLVLLLQMRKRIQ
ncbi:MAG: iron ABC transporter permease [Pseudomonadota bacterium]|nr:iron ABC transporter permease [Pseudomonadota bacterium]